MKIFAIALNTSREAIRNKVLYSILLFACLVTGSLRRVRLGVYRRHHQVREGLQSLQHLALRCGDDRRPGRQPPQQGARQTHDLQHSVQTGAAMAVPGGEVPRPAGNAYSHDGTHDSGAPDSSLFSRGEHRLADRARRCGHGIGARVFSRRSPFSFRRLSSHLRWRDCSRLQPSSPAVRCRCSATS